MALNLKDTEGVNRSRKSKMDSQYNDRKRKEKGQKDKQRSTKHYTKCDNFRSDNFNVTSKNHWFSSRHK